MKISLNKIHSYSKSHSILIYCINGLLGHHLLNKDSKFRYFNSFNQWYWWRLSLHSKFILIFEIIVQIQLRNCCSLYRKWSLNFHRFDTIYYIIFLLVNFSLLWRFILLLYYYCYLKIHALILLKVLIIINCSEAAKKLS